MKNAIKCNKVIRMLSSYIDGELPVKRKDAVFLHLQNCSRCRQEYKTLLRLKDTLSRLETPILPETVKDRLKNLPKTKQKDITLLRFSYKLRALPIAASIVLTIASALFVGDKLADFSSFEEIPQEYQIASESLYTLWETIDYEQ